MLNQFDGATSHWRCVSEAAGVHVSSKPANRNISSRSEPGGARGSVPASGFVSFPLLRCEIWPVGVGGDNESVWYLITFQHQRSHAAVITPTGGLLIDATRPKHHSGTNVSLLHRPNKATRSASISDGFHDRVIFWFLVSWLGEEPRRQSRSQISPSLRTGSK